MEGKVYEILDEEDPNFDGFRRCIIQTPNPNDCNFRQVSNRVVTSKYTLWNFIPLNLWDQFQEVSNIYFFIIGILQIIPEITTTDGVPDNYIPLSFILFVSGVRAAVDDYAKHKEDNKVAGRTVQVYNPGYASSHRSSTERLDRVTRERKRAAEGFYYERSGNLKVGDIVRVQVGETFPADMVLLNSAHPTGHCFVETASLDGETNLKLKEAVPQFLTKLGSSNDLDGVEGKLEVEIPRKELEEFNGSFIPKEGEGKRFRLEAANLLLRGTALKNTQWVHGVVVYCGAQTKIRLNAKSESDSNITEKRSQIMTKVTRLLYSMMLLQVSFCLLGAIFSAVWFQGRKNAWYLQLGGHPAREAVLRFFSWFIVLAQFVPISLIVSSEVVKRLQQFLLESDIDLFDSKKGPVKVNNSQINEDLGQVEYIFTDKTGTLTQNKMEFRCALIGNEIYGSQETEISRRVAEKKLHGGEGPPRRMWEEELQDLDDEEGHYCSHDDKGQEEKEIDPTEDILDDDSTLGIELGSGNSDFKGQQRRPLNGEEGGATGSAKRKRNKRQERFEKSEKDRMMNVMSGGGERKDASHSEDVRDYMLHMAISNTVNPVTEMVPGKGPVTSYQSSSPDELALCQFAALIGYKFVQRDGARVKVEIESEEGKREEKYFWLQAVLPFDSVRKRVTVIYSDKERKSLWVMCKGADSCVLPLVDAKESKDVLGDLDQTLIKMANNGLRTLLVAQRKNKSFSWWEKHRDEFERVRKLRPQDVKRNADESEMAWRRRAKERVQAERRSVYRKIELDAGMRLLGATAIEDRLQNLVPECIRDFLIGGIKVWMLTGDKRETAKNIAMACNLIEPDMVENIETPSSPLPAAAGGGRGRSGGVLESARSFNQDRLIEITGQWNQLTNNRAQLKRLFATLDADGSGYIDKNEMMEFMLVLKYPGDSNKNRMAKLKQAVDDLFVQYDTDNTGKISKEQFLKAMETFQVSLFQAVKADVDAGLHRAGEIGDLESTPISMVVEGGHPSALSEILQDSDAEASGGTARDELRERFFELAALCKSVVACRCTPRQKALIIREIKKRKGACVLAVGDGGNDEPMIKEADVGVGIFGEEGSAAAQAADFAIGQFRFLHPLLFKHGVWLYDRIAIMTLYIFYKAAMVALAMFYFGFFSGFSAHQLFNLWAYTAYNVAFTCTPILVVAVLDQTLSAQTLQNQPLAYRACITRGQLFSNRIFFVWIQQAMVHTALIFFIAFWALESDNIAFPDGKTHGLWTTSTVIYSVIVMVATFRLLLEMRSFTYCHHFWVWFSFFGFYAAMIILNIFPSFNPDLYFVVFQMIRSPQIWLTVILCTVLPLILDLMVYGVKADMFPHYHQILREREMQPGLKVAPQEETFVFRERKTRVQEIRHRKKYLQALQAAQEAKKAVSEEEIGAVEREAATKRRARIMLTWLRYQNMSGANFDGTDDAETIETDKRKRKKTT